MLTCNGSYSTQQGTIELTHERRDEMTCTPVSYLLDRMPFGNSLQGVSPALLDKLMAQSHAPSWHRYAILSRKWRRHACTACRWLNEALPKGASIFEPGCGSGANLLWLGQRGFSRLSGSDINPEALELGNALASHLRIPLDLWRDDGMTPDKIPENLDAILSVNWLYHVRGASFSSFLNVYVPWLKVGGYIACDMVTRSYDKTPGNQYHTNDLKLPVEKRRPSEYTLRLDLEEMNSIAIRHGLALMRHTCFVLSKPQRSVYLFRKVE